MRNAPAAVTLVLSLSVAAIATQACGQRPPFESRVGYQVLTSWYDLERKLVEMCEDFPEERYAYKPSPEARSFSEIVRHVTEENFAYIETARGEPINRGFLGSRRLDVRKELVASLKQSFDEGAALIASTSDRDMLDQVTNPYGKRLMRLAFWLELVQHAAEHYGNLVTYYRLNGLVPPETRRMQHQQPSREPLAR